MHLLQYLLSKCINSTNQNQFGGATSLSNYSHINPLGGLNAAAHGDRLEGTIFSSSSVTGTENMMDRSFEDERRNMFEQIKSLLISKMLIIQKTIKGINISKELARVKEWNYDQFTQNQQNTTSPVADLKSNNKSHARERRRTQVSATSLKNINTFRTHNSWGNNLNSELNKIDNDTPKSPELNRLDSNSTM